MEKYTPPTERTGTDTLREEIAAISQHALISSLLDSVAGLFAVLDKNRQIIAVNHYVLDLLGVEDEVEILGLRPGEAMHCAHVLDNPLGCGTGRPCSSCGAALSIVASLDNRSSHERTCVLSVKKEDKVTDLCLRVRSAPFDLEGERFVLLFLQDITEHKMLSAMEGIFFHDVSNALNSLVGISCFLTDDHPDNELVKMLGQTVRRLKKDIDIQRSLAYRNNPYYTLHVDPLSTETIFADLRDFYLTHSAAAGKTFEADNGTPGTVIKTDPSLFFRVMMNLLTNAFEAAEKGGTIRLWSVDQQEKIAFHIWNSGMIPLTSQLRIFQKHFTTKPGISRGLGTYAVKLFTEEYLKGEVTFTTSEKDGTEFVVTFLKTLEG